MAEITYPQDWKQRHDSADLVYRLRLRFDTGMTRKTVWEQLEKDGTVGETGSILIGGAAIQRVDAADEHHKTDVIVISGGEDALDSLDYALEDLTAAVQKTGATTPTLVDSQRTLER